MNFFLWLSILTLFFSSNVFGQEKTISRIGIVNGRATKLPIPDYPQEAKDSCAAGKVEIEVLIGEDGSVLEAKAISGDKLLRDSSVKAAKEAKFYVGHFSIKVRGIIIYNFDYLAKTKCKEDSQEKSEPTAILLGILNDRATYLPQPKYPGEVLQPYSKGNVSVQIKINLQEGKVVSATAVSGNPLFKKYAEEAALQAKFQPKKIDGSPLFATGVLIYKQASEEKETDDSPSKRVLPIIVSGVVNKRAKYLPKPTYPKSCRCSGTIKVQIVIDESGNVVSASANSGNPLLRVACVKAARQAKFAPTLINGDGQIYVVAFFEYKF